MVDDRAEYQRTVLVAIDVVIVSGGCSTLQFRNN